MLTIINGTAIAFEDHGSGLPLLLIHGFPLSRRIWTPQIDALTGEFRVITPDLRGFGESEAPEGEYTMDTFADDTIGLMDHLGIENAVICGMSMGGYVAMNMLDRYPDRVRAACFMVTRAAADDDAGKERRFALAREVMLHGPQIVVDAFSRVLFSAAAADRESGVVSEVCRIMAATSPIGLAGGLMAMRERQDYTLKLAAFAKPSLVIGAEEDLAIPADESIRMAGLLPDSRLVIIPKAGHMAGMENPTAVNDALLEFLRSLP